MKLDDATVGELLVKENYIRQEDLLRAQEEAKNSNQSLREYLVASNVLTKHLIGQAIAESYGLVYANLDANTPSLELLKRLPEQVSKSERLVVYKQVGENIVFASDEPARQELDATVRQYFPNVDYRIIYSLPEDIDSLLNTYRKPLDTRFSNIIKSQQNIAPEIIDEVISDALTNRASDIHLEPREGAVVIRFRVDGILRDAGNFPKDQYEKIVNRIKIQSELRIDEHNSIQDGSIHAKTKNGNADLRVSIIPTLGGEKIVIRILTEYVKVASLSNLGLKNSDHDAILKAVKKPHGMILTAGPTGSGKTTTLYGLIRILNSPDINITTIEDPVEYHIDTISQVQVNPATNITFARGLRSIVRQDPDVILVGEIRDTETAEIAVNAALTGHLLLSTLHANDASTAIPRLIEMGIEPFLVASTLELVVAQRLVRHICTNCRYSCEVMDDPGVQAHPYLLEKLGGATVYRGRGCDTCNGSGYTGRVGVFEIIKVSDRLRELILTSPSAREVREIAVHEGTQSLFADGIEKIKMGVTTTDEIIRVAPSD